MGSFEKKARHLVPSIPRCLALAHLLLGYGDLSAQLEARIITSGTVTAESGQPLDAVKLLIVDGGKPLSGRQVVLEVRLSPDDNRRVRVTGNRAITDSAGIAEFDKLVLVVSSKLTVELVPKIDGLVPKSSPTLRAAVAARTPSLVLINAPPAGFLISGRSDTPLTVQVVDDGGSPFGGAEVVLHADPACGPANGNRATTGTDGRATFPDLIFLRPLDPKSCKLIAEAEYAGTEAIQSEEAEILLRAGQASKVIFLPPRPSVFFAGEPTGLSVRVLDAVGNPMPNELVTLAVSDPSIRITEGSGSASTNQNGVAIFPGLTLMGKPGSVALVATAGEATTGEADKLSAALNAGPPRIVSVIVQPPSLTVTESLFTRVPVVRVDDYAGNHLEKQEVRVSLCRKEDRLSTPITCDTVPAELSGTPIRKSNEEGVARFDSLALSGKADGYFLKFDALGCSGKCEAGISSTVRYDPDLLLDRNFVEIGAIKSVAGDKPASEFFALRFKFRLSRKGITIWKVRDLKLFALAYTDIALSNRESEDSVSSSTDHLDEAAMSLNLQFRPHQNTWNQVPMRSFFIGGAFQVFQTVPYIGMQMGSIEHSGSPFQGSAITVGVLRTLYDTPVLVNKKPVRPSDWNAFAHFYIRSSGVDFFKHLSLRGSFLLPFLKGQTIASRIAIIVPIETLKDF